MASESVLVPDAKVITLGSEAYPVQGFCLAKTMRMLAMLTELSEKAGLADVLVEAQAVGWLATLLGGLPKVMAVAEDKVFDVMALTLMPNKRVFEIAEMELDFGAEIRADAKKLKTNPTLNVDKAFEIVEVGVQSMGLDALKTNFTKLLDLIPGAPPAAETASPETSG